MAQSKLHLDYINMIFTKLEEEQAECFDATRYKRLQERAEQNFYTPFDEVKDEVKKYNYETFYTFMPEMQEILLEAKSIGQQCGYDFPITEFSPTMMYIVLKVFDNLF